MRHGVRAGLAVVVVALAAACTEDRPRIVEAVAYAPGLALDLHLPDDPAGVPLVVLVHGGGFAFGAREQMEAYARALAGDGLAAALIDYTLSPGSWFPTDRLDDPGLRQAAALARDDTLAAVAWLQEAAATYGYDPRRVVVAGYSAGGITAIEAATHGATVAGAFAIAGAGVELDAIDAGDPPLAAVHGDRDEVIPAALARATCERAQSVGVACELVTLSGVGHEIASAERGRIVDLLAEFAGRVPPRG